MLMFFRAAGVHTIIQGASPPKDPDAKAKWDALDDQLVAYVFGKVHSDYLYLVEDLESGKEAWAKLKAHFEKSTLGHRMQVRQAFHSVTHDPSRPVDFYIQDVVSAAGRLKSLGCTVDDSEVIDVILMNLDPSFHTIRSTILAQEKDPGLDKIQLMLTSATSAEVLDTHNSALAASGKSKARHSSKSHSSSQHSSSHAHSSGHSSSHRPASPVDSKGFRWCNPTSEKDCHRCGRSGHVAARCMYNMPQEVKDWVMATSSWNSGSHIQKANTVYHFLSSPPGSPHSSPPSSPPPSPALHASFADAFLGPLLL